MSSVLKEKEPFDPSAIRPFDKLRAGKLRAGKKYWIPYQGKTRWIPAFAGMTQKDKKTVHEPPLREKGEYWIPYQGKTRWIPAFAGMTQKDKKTVHEPPLREKGEYWIPNQVWNDIKKRKGKERIDKRARHAVPLRQIRKDKRASTWALPLQR